MDGNIVENIIKYCQTSKIAVVFIHKTCNKVKSILIKVLVFYLKRRVTVRNAWLWRHLTNQKYPRNSREFPPGILGLEFWPCSVV